MTHRFWTVAAVVIEALLLLLLIEALILAQASIAHADELGVQSTDTSGWPAVGITLTLPASAKGASPSAVRVWENGVEVNAPRIKNLSADRQAVDVVLVIDVSGSMKGAPLADAQTAARHFASLMAPQDRIAVVSFGSPAKVISGLSGDSTAVQAAIGGLTDSGQTALYDGLVTAADVLKKGSTGRNAIVVLSDGKDTASASDLNAAVAAARDARAPVYAVALKASDYDPKALGTIANATGGRLASVQQSAAFDAIFGALAAELQQGYEVTFVSNKPNTPDLEVRIAVDGAGLPLGKTVFLSNPAFEASAQPYVPMPPRSLAELAASFATQGGIVLLIAASVGLVSYVGISSVIRGRRPIDELAYYDQVHATGFETVSDKQGAVDRSRTRVVGLVGEVASRRGFTGLAHMKLERAGLPLRANEYITLHVLGVFVLGVLAAWFTQNVLIVGVVIALATTIPLLVLQSLETRRRAAFDEQLPDILLLMAGSLRAGWGLQQSIDLVVQQAAEPAVAEFARVQAEVRLGLPLDKALSRVAERLDSTDFRWTASAIGIQREVGGNLSEVLETLAATMRERAMLFREVKALTAEGRFSAVILELLPFFIAAALYFINPGYVGLLLNTQLGLMVLGGAAILLIVGIIWLQSEVRIDV
jgi:tight adherence protein B